jgi:cytochrome c oxidase accessory protein FixG
VSKVQPGAKMSGMQTPQRRSSIEKDGRRLKIYPADVRGRFHRARSAVFVLLMMILIALPFVSIHGRPGIWLDVATRHFYFFGGAFNAQDTYLMFFVLTLLAFTIVVLTTILGRVWCGWACPQTVFLEGLYRPIERLFQGDRNNRMKRDAGPWTFDRSWRFLATQGVYLVLSTALAHVFVAYFVSASRLFGMMSHGPGQNPEPFVWVAAVTAVFYGNFAWFREQTCLVVCPYGRMQSVLFDRDSLIIGYDEKRGEPRERGGRKGDCVDCNRCVVVCPTGIDIRNGLQVDCIACAACVDACDDVMVKIGKPRGLVRYDSLRGLSGEAKRFMRPRIVAYAALLLVLASGLALAMRKRVTFEANVLRLPGAPYQVDTQVPDGSVVRNAFQVHLVNKNDRPEAFRLTPLDAPGLTVVLPLADLTLEPSGSQNLPMFVTGPATLVTGVVHIRVERVGGEVKTIDAPFLSPGRLSPTPTKPSAAP